MRKIAPSHRHRQELAELLHRGLFSAGTDLEEDDFLGRVLRKSVQRVVAEVLEQELTDHLGRDWYQRDGRASSGYRNGFARER